MILRRLMKHVSDQNWFAVGLDFLIVVFGVAAGFQLNGMYAESQRRHAEQDYLAGIATDYGIYEGLLVCRTDQTAQIIAGLDLVIAAIDGAELDAAEARQARAALDLAQFVSAGFPLEGNTSALVGGDLVATISDKTLRGLILAAQSLSSVNVTTLAQWGQYATTLPRYDRFVSRVETPEVGFYTVSQIDLAAMRADPDVRNTLINWSNLHRGTRNADFILTGAVQQVLERLVVLEVIAPRTEPARCPYGPAAGGE
ncbi:hypothetical protein [Maricaulis sp. CAU 1757]